MINAFKKFFVIGIALCAVLAHAAANESESKAKNVLILPLNFQLFAFSNQLLHSFIGKSPSVFLFRKIHGL